MWLYGENITMKKEKVDFHSLQERGHVSSARDIERLRTKSPATFVVFDILEKDGQSLVDLPLMQRKAILKESVKEGSHIIINNHIEPKIPKSCKYSNFFSRVVSSVLLQYNSFVPLFFITTLY
jgi:ATP-dependent DNA ligase